MAAEDNAFAGLGAVKSWRRLAGLAFCIGLVVVGWAGCAFDDSRSLDSDLPDGSELRWCAVSADCTGGEICREGVCRTACESDADCAGAAPQCDGSLGYCVECLAEADCGVTETCASGMCVFYCRADEDCGHSEYCAFSTGVCEPRDCVTNADCRGGFICGRMGCEPVDDLVCEPDEVRCSADRGAVEVCDEDGLSIDEVFCGADALCLEDGGVVRCVPVLCEPFEVGCLDAETAFACDGTGTQRESLPCGSGRYCLDAECFRRQCEPGAVVCEGDTVVECDELGRIARSEVCAETESCMASEEGCSCSEGDCVERICVPGQRRCVGGGAQTCGTDGLAWGTTVPCAEDEVCVAGSCLAMVCEPGRMTCSGDVLLTCDPLGLDRSETDCAASERLCAVSGGAAACVERVCEPDAVSCTTDARAVLRCDARGAVETEEACPAGTECRPGGLCVEPPPIPAPTGVTASLGTSASRVEVSWNAVSGASGYHVYRDGLRVTSSPVAGTSWSDHGAPPGGAPRVVEGLSATTDRFADVRLSWEPAAVPDGGSVAYRVRAVVDGREGMQSEPAVGHRSGAAVTAYEVQVEGGAWNRVGDVLVWTDTVAPAGELSVGLPVATRTLADRVDLTVAPATVAEAIGRRYRVRAISDAGMGPSGPEVLGHRVVGTPSYRWQWSPAPAGGFSDLAGGNTRSVSDTLIGEGETRWYRVVVSATGAASVTSSAVEGRRPGDGEDDGLLGSPCTSHEVCPPASWCPTNTLERRCSPRPVVGGVELRFQWVPAGTFIMGSPEAELGRSLNEEQVTVTLSRDYFVQRTPVTQAQWAAVITAWNALPPDGRRMTGWSGATPVFGTAPSCFRSSTSSSCTGSGTVDDAPVERVSWWDAVVFANVLSALEGLEPCYMLADCGTDPNLGSVGWGCAEGVEACGPSDGTFSCAGVSIVGPQCSGYRLLTEAEWERAARGETTTATYAGDLSGVSGCVALDGAGGYPPATPLSDLAWYSCNSSGRTQPVGGKAPNIWGLYDMLGNAWEWTWTRYGEILTAGVDPAGPSSGAERVLRGGSWSNGPPLLRAAMRYSDDPRFRGDVVGFRLARSAGP